MRELLQKDSEYAKFRQIVQTVRSFDLDKSLAEADRLHATRKTRLLHAHKLSPQKLQEAQLVELSHRSRLVELRSILSRQYELLGTAIETMKKHIRVKYSQDLQDHARTASERSLVVDRLLSSPLKLKSQLSGAMEIFDAYIRDIDSASYALRNSVELLKMILDRRGVEEI